MNMKRTLPTIAVLVGLSVTQALPVRAESRPDEREQQIEDLSTSGLRELDETGLTPVLRSPERDEVRVTPYRGEEPGYMSGQTRLFGTSGGH